MKNLIDPINDLEKFLIEMNGTQLARRTFLSALPWLLVGCATSKTRYREGDNTDQNVELTPSDEAKLTQEVLPQMRKDYPLLNNDGMQRYVQDLGQKLVRSNSLHNNPYSYSFSVVNVNYVNAFALPAGTVFITAPLIAMADSEAELMGVIGHEVGHIQARHTAERMFAAKKAQSKSWLYGIGGGLAGAALGLGLGKLACRKEDTKCLRKATELGAVAGIGGGLLIQKYAFMANSREDEMEADRIGFRTALAAGYDKDKIGLFYEKLYEMEKRSKSKNQSSLLNTLSDAMSTHPPSAERVQQMKTMATEATVLKRGIVSTSEFSKMKAIAQKVSTKQNNS